MFQPSPGVFCGRKVFVTQWLVCFPPPHLHSLPCFCAEHQGIALYGLTQWFLLVNVRCLSFSCHLQYHKQRSNFADTRGTETATIGQICRKVALIWQNCMVVKTAWGFVELALVVVITAPGGDDLQAFWSSQCTSVNGASQGSHQVWC